MSRIFHSIAISLVLFSSSAYAEEAIRLAAATSLKEGIFDKISGAFKSETGIAIQYVETGKERSLNKYLKELLAGKADAAVASIVYDDWVKLMKEENVQIPPNVQLTNRVVGRDLIHIFAHQSAGVSDLSVKHVEALLTGRIKNWKEVGGADLPVIVIAGTDNPSLERTLSKLALKDAPIAAAKKVKTAKDKADAIASTPGGIIYETYEVQLPNVVKFKTSIIGRPATMITIGRPTPNVEKLINFIRTNGQKFNLGQ